MSKLRAKFFKDGNKDMVEVSIVGDPCTMIRRVKPQDETDFPHEWAAYFSGQGHVDVGGTPLTDVPGITAPMATAYRLKGVRNAEELAALDDAAIRTLGMNALAFRLAAQNLLAARELAELKAARDVAKKAKKEPEAVAA